MATYTQIQDFIILQFGKSVKTCWIAHAKEIYGLPHKKASNGIDPLKRTNPCPDNMLNYIKQAFQHYGML